MPLTPIETLTTVLVITLGTMLTRFTPFILFPENKEPPKVVVSLGKMLPPAMMGLLVIYCLKDISFISGSHGLPELIAITAIIIIHKWKKNVLLSIGVGTIIYMLLEQFVFV